MRFRFGNRAQIPLWEKILLGVIPFLFAALLYNHFATQRLIENPRDKVLPSVSKMYHSMSEFVMKTDRHSGKQQFFEDLKASVISLIAGISVAFVLALFIGITAGSYPLINALVMPIITVFSAIPPAAIVPVLFMIADPGYELSILFIFMALFFVLVKDIVNQIHKIPRNLNTLLFTKGASELELGRENLYMILPGILQSLKINLPLVWFALLYGETLGAQNGLGTRIFILKRFSANDIIFPYILVITLIAVTVFYGIEFIIRKRYAWYNGDEK
ncbi:ABC transporter permease subunit [bacterium]|nr:ABC transporter permease subunit [bacterium]MBU1883271.1 ABC transporter permease subunit [bacterium]